MSIDTSYPTVSLGAAAASVVEQVAEKRASAALNEHAPGVYFGMPESAYFSDPALGSSAMKELATNPADWWWGSRYNTLEDDEDAEKDTPSQILGRAVHKILLEGLDAFKASYGYTTEPLSTKAGKEQKAFIEAEGKTAIKANVYRRCFILYSAVQSNEEYAAAFQNGMPEVTVFWERDGIRRRARFDFLRIKTTVDLKTTANERSKPPREQSASAMADWGYHIQAQHYREGREFMRQFAREGRVFGDYDTDLFERIVENDVWNSTFVFVQAKGTPNITAPVIAHNAAILDDARMAIEQAERNFKEWCDRFGGVENPWISLDAPYAFDVEDMPSWWQFRRRVA